MAQLAWVHHHLADIESDMSAIHRVDDTRQMPAPRFFSLAWRLPYYQGVMQARAAAQRAAEPESPSRRPAPAPRRQELMPVTQAVVASDPALRGIFSFG